MNNYCMSEVVINTHENIVSGNRIKEQTLKSQTYSGVKGSTYKKNSKIRLEKSAPEVKSGFESSSKKDKVLEIGPLESMFPCSESKILDFLVVFQEYDYSISDIAENSGVGFKTTLGVVKNLEIQQVIVNTRNVGRAKMYKLNLESSEANVINKLALGIATVRAENQMQ